MKSIEEQIQILSEQISLGNMFAWQDGDSGMFEAISSNQTSSSYEEAQQDLAEELYSDKDISKWPGWSKKDLFLHCVKFSDSDENKHTWIYNLQECLDELREENEILKFPKCGACGGYHDPDWYCHP